MSLFALIGMLVFTLLALFALVQHPGSGQMAGLPRLAKMSRTLVDLTKSLGGTEAEDVKFIERGIASCELSLQAHSDRVLNGVKDVRRIMDMLVQDENSRVALTRKISSASRKMVGKCPSGPARLSLHVNFAEGQSMPSGVYFSMDLPAGSRLPVFQGDIGKTCRVGRKEQSRQIFLSNVDLVALAPQVAADGTFGEDLASTVLSYGARDVTIDAKDDGLVDFYALLACQNSSQLLYEYVAVTENIRVGQAREVLSDGSYGTDRELARSFMVVGFLGRYFDRNA